MRWNLMACTFTMILFTGGLQGLHARANTDDGGNNAAADTTQRDAVSRADQELARRVREKVVDYDFYGIFDWVQVRVQDSVVTLSGWVRARWEKPIFGKLALEVAGVKRVNNQLDWTFGPGKLGLQAAQLIYGDPMFQGFAYSWDPPIHIIVVLNKVILEGEVSTENEREQAEFLVRYQTDAVSVGNNLRVALR